MEKKLLIMFVLGIFLSSCLVEDELRDPIVELKGAPKPYCTRHYYLN
jgi:hypothetical protein